MPYYHYVSGHCDSNLLSHPAQAKIGDLGMAARLEVRGKECNQRDGRPCLLYLHAISLVA